MGTDQAKWQAAVDAAAFEIFDMLDKLSPLQQIAVGVAVIDKGTAELRIRDGISRAEELRRESCKRRADTELVRMVRSGDKHLLVRLVGEVLQIVDLSGRVRHRSAGHMETAVHLAAQLIDSGATP